jgi:hypothetical protein
MGDLIMKLQRCVFRAEKDGEWKDGIAQLKFSWGCHDVSWIVDCNSGYKYGNIWDYQLLDGPGCYINTEE